MEHSLEEEPDPEEKPKEIEPEKEPEPEITETGLEEIQAENKLLQEKIDTLENEIKDLKYKIYMQLNKKQANPEITVDGLANKIVDVVNRVIRDAQGKVS